MKTRPSLHALGAATLIALGAAAAHAVEFTDPKGDDKGPGAYTYPTDPVYKTGSFDLVKFSATKNGANVDIAVDVASSLEDPWGMGGGFAVQMVFIFIKTGAPDAVTPMHLDGAERHVRTGQRVEQARDPVAAEEGARHR
jgi:carbohydrate-binding DOMON domain-containing protein